MKKAENFKLALNCPLSLFLVPGSWFNQLYYTSLNIKQFPFQKVLQYESLIFALLHQYPACISVPFPLK